MLKGFAMTSLKTTALDLPLLGFGPFVNCCLLFILSGDAYS